MKGVEIFPIDVHADDRGWLFEFMKAGTKRWADVKQVNVSYIYPNAIKAFHLHKEQTDFVCCPIGNVKLVVLKEINEVEFERETYYLGEKTPMAIKISPNIWHGYAVTGNKPAMLLYATDKTWNESDEFRRPYDFLGDIWSVKNR